MERNYLDYAATAPLEPEIAEEMQRVSLEHPGNPSSLHREGKAARKIVEAARERCADTLSLPPERLIFTSGGTESNAIPLGGLLNLKRRGSICISGIEHPAVWEFTRTFRHFGFDVRILNPDARGIIRPEEVERQLSPDTLAVAVMAVNNEIGSIQPLSEIVERVRSYERSSGAEIRIHCDAVQALGKIDLSPEELGVDTMAFSAHKLGGPKGVGMLYTRAPLNVLSPAGGQEGGLRGGTENVSGIHGLSLAVERAVAARIEGHTRMRELKQRIAGRLDAIEGLRLLPSAVLEEAGHFSPYILSFTAAPVPGEVLVRVMDDRGFSISTGSACSANSRKKRHRVLKAIGIDDADAAGAVRISWGSSVEASQLESFCATVQRELPLLRKTAGVR